MQLNVVISVSIKTKLTLLRTLTYPLPCIGEKVCMLSLYGRE